MSWVCRARCTERERANSSDPSFCARHVRALGLLSRRPERSFKAQSKRAHPRASEEHLNYEADYVVVGAGAAGSVLAARLAEDGKRSVIVIEAGPDNTADPTVAAAAKFAFLYDMPKEVGPHPSPSRTGASYRRTRTGKDYVATRAGTGRGRARPTTTRALTAAAARSFTRSGRSRPVTTVGPTRSSRRTS